MNKKYVITGVMLVGVIVGGLFWMKKNQGIPFIQAPTATDEKSKGTADAPIRIVEYSDFQCPSCMKAQPLLNDIMKDYPGKIQLIFRHFPLSGHLWAHVAHQAAECANQEGQFWIYHDKLFEEQPNWSGPQNPTESFLRYAKELDLNVHAFANCMSDEAVTKRVIKDKKMGEKDQVRSTPTFLINGERIVGGVELRIRGIDMIRDMLGLPKVVSKPKASRVPSTSQG